MKTTLQALLLMLFLAFVAAPALAQEAEPAPDDFIAVEKEAAALNMDEVRRKLVYPEFCKQVAIQGKVFVRILVSKDGKVIKHEVKKSPHDLMTKEVERVIYDINFSPATQQGEPIACWITIPFDFKLRDPDPVQPIPENYDEVLATIEYPKKLKKKRVEGFVVLNVLVSPEGKVKNHEPVSTPHADLTKAVEKKLGDLRFSKPAKDTWVKVVFPFKAG